MQHPSTPALTAHAIAAKQAELQHKKGLLVHLPKKSGVSRHRLEAAIQKLETEISVLKASLHYLKPPEVLALEIETQKRRVQTFVTKARHTKGTERKAAIAVLKSHNQGLKEMLAAAKLKRLNPNLAAPVPQGSAPAPMFILPTTASLPTNGLEADALAAESAQPAPSVSPAQALAVELSDYNYLGPLNELSLGDGINYSEFEPEFEIEYAGALNEMDVDYKSLLIGAALGLGVGWYFFRGPK